MNDKLDITNDYRHEHKEHEETDCWSILCRYAENYPFGEDMQDELGLKNIS